MWYMILYVCGMRYDEIWYMKYDTWSVMYMMLEIGWYVMMRYIWHIEIGNQDIWNMIHQLSSITSQSINQSNQPITSNYAYSALLFLLPFSAWSGATNRCTWDQWRYVPLKIKTNPNHYDRYDDNYDYRYNDAYDDDNGNDGQDSTINTNKFYKKHYHKK